MGGPARTTQDHFQDQDHYRYTDQEWAERREAMVAEAQRKREAKAVERAQRKRARDWGLAQRHAAKLARLRGPQNRGQG